MYHGIWRIPEGVPHYNNAELMGTLTIEDDGSSKLEVYIIQRRMPVFRSCGEYAVIWGDTADGIKVTLFGASSIWDEKKPELFCLAFKINKVFMGDHLKTGDEELYDLGVIKFQYLRNWAYTSGFQPQGLYKTADLRMNNLLLLDAEIEEGLQLKIHQHYDVLDGQFEQKTIQTSFITLHSEKLTSVNHFVDVAGKLSQFLSLALFSHQAPSGFIVMKNSDPRYNKVFQKVSDSINPQSYSLIPFNELRDKLPSILKRWFDNYDQLSQICHYLLSALNDDEFDAPDFLIIAQALDGFHKRFLNKRKGKDHRKYKDQIDAMLKEYRDVRAIANCNIDSDVMTNTRNKYSHLFPDSEDKGNEANGYGLFRLTQKAKVLLTCCILDLLGLTHQEIDLCFEKSAFKPVIDG